MRIHRKTRTSKHQENQISGFEPEGFRVWVLGFRVRKPRASKHQENQIRGIEPEGFRVWVLGFRVEWVGLFHKP